MIEQKIFLYNNSSNYFGLPASFSYFVPDFLGVYSGIKPVMCGNASIKDLRVIKDICSKNNLFFDTSDYRFYVDPKTLYKVKTTNKNIDSYAQVFVSRDKKKIAIAKKNYFERIVENGKLIDRSEEEIRNCGRVLGYPECCIDNLINSDFHSSFTNAVYEALRRSKKIHFLLNSLTSLYYLIPYFPCSFDCRESLIYAKKLLGVMKKLEPERYRATKFYLKLPYLFINYMMGIIFDGSIKNSEVSYSDFNVFGQVDNVFLEALERGNKCCILEKSIKVMRDSRLVKKINRDRPSSYFLLNFQ